MKKFKVLMVVLAAIITGAAAAIILISSRPAPDTFKEVPGPFKELPSLAADSQLTPEQMKADLDYLTDTLSKTHPKTVNGFSDSQNKVIKHAYSQVTSPRSLTDFYFIADSIICTFNDPHTSARDVVNDCKYIQAYFRWFSDGFYSVADCGELHKGDKLASIGGIALENLLQKLGEVIPHENEYCLYTMAENKLVLTQYLKYAGVDISGGTIRVSVERNGKPAVMELPVISSNEWEKGYPPQTFVPCTFKIDTAHDLGYLRLDTCTDDPSYQITLYRLFKGVADNKINNIVVDLRNNPGGDSRVANRFIQYLDVAQYKDFSSYTRYSPLAKKRNGYTLESGDRSNMAGVSKNQRISDKSLLFHKKVYILTSHITFSSANMFALYFKDNDFGTIIGEETGNSPSCCGDILMDQLPNSRIVFTVSHKIFHRPDTAKDHEDTVYPDIIVRTTIDDFISGRDPVMQRIFELTTAGK